MTHKSGLDLINSDARLIAVLICGTGPKRSEEMCGRKKGPSLLRSSERTHCVVLNPNKMGANVDQKTGKYLTDWDYSKSQMNNIVFKKYAFKCESNIPCLTFTIGMQCHAKWISPRWPLPSQKKLSCWRLAYYLVVAFFPHPFLLCPRRLGCLATCLKGGWRPFCFEVFTLEGHGIRCVRGERERENCDSLKKRERGWAGLARTEKGALAKTLARLPRKERRGLVRADQKELISCDIIELYINNVPEKWVAERRLTGEAECVKTRARNNLSLAERKIVTRAAFTSEHLESNVSSQAPTLMRKSQSGEGGGGGRKTHKKKYQIDAGNPSASVRNN